MTAIRRRLLLLRHHLRRKTARLRQFFYQFLITGIRHAIEGKNIMLINSTDKEKGAQQKDFLVTGTIYQER